MGDIAGGVGEHPPIPTVSGAWDDYLAEMSHYLDRVAAFAPGPPPTLPTDAGVLPDELHDAAASILERMRGLEAVLERRRSEVGVRISAIPQQPLVRDWA